MEFEEVLKKRHSVRKFQKKEIPQKLIEKVLEMANLSPSAGNLQARSIVIVRDEKIKKRLSFAALKQEPVAEAPLLFLVCANLEESALKYGKRGIELYSVQDATIFASYLQLAITNCGLTSCWIGAFDEDDVREALGLREEIRPIAIIPTGYADEKPDLTSRKSLDKIIKKQL